MPYLGFWSLSKRPGSTVKSIKPAGIRLAFRRIKVAEWLLNWSREWPKAQRWWVMREFQKSHSWNDEGGAINSELKRPLDK